MKFCQECGIEEYEKCGHNKIVDLECPICENDTNLTILTKDKVYCLACEVNHKIEEALKK